MQLRKCNNSGNNNFGLSNQRSLGSRSITYYVKALTVRDLLLLIQTIFNMPSNVPIIINVILMILNFISINDLLEKGIYI